MVHIGIVDLELRAKPTIAVIHLVCVRVRQLQPRFTHCGSSRVDFWQTGSTLGFSAWIISQVSRAQICSLVKVVFADVQLLKAWWNSVCIFTPKHLVMQCIFRASIQGLI